MGQLCHLPELHTQTWTLQLDSVPLPSKTHSTPPQRRVQMKTTVKAVLNRNTLPLKLVIKKAIQMVMVMVMVKKKTAPGLGIPPALRPFLGIRRTVSWCAWMERRKSGTKLELPASTTPSTCCRGLVSCMLPHNPPGSCCFMAGPLYLPAHHTIVHLGMQSCHSHACKRDSMEAAFPRGAGWPAGLAKCITV